ncbi:MAG: hypothetical protein KG075_03845 [Alphaproteobacteria bacterium]|nr:hypothetical protein [Alphaproteobacteria bacterium]
MKQLKKALLGTPASRTAISTVLTILVGVFSGGLVNEITVNGLLVWGMIHKTTSLYGLGVVIFLVILFEVMKYEFDQGVLNFASQQFCEAYLRSQMLPELAEQNKKFLREGRVEELREATRAVNNLLNLKVEP